MALPLLLLGCATALSAALAYGMHPAWGRYTWGIDLIAWSRQWQWLLFFGAMLPCVALLGLVAAGRRRAWWLIGLAPVMALLAHRYHSARAFPGVLDDPPMVAPDEAALDPREHVVGVRVGEAAFALPYSALFRAPAVVVSDFDRRVLVLFSPDANFAAAWTLRREMRARRLELLGTPANGLLLYDRRLGQVIEGVTGLTTAGRSPTGFGSAVPVERTTWGAWRQRHPSTRVLPPGDGPRVPILPRYGVPRVEPDDPTLMISLLRTTPPIAVAQGQVMDLGARTLHLGEGGLRLLLIEDSATRRLRAFDRAVEGDLFITLRRATAPGAPRAVFRDDESGSLWDRDARAIEGPLAGTALREIPVEPELFWGTMKRWLPDLRLLSPSSPGAATP